MTCLNPQCQRHERGADELCNDCETEAAIDVLQTFCDDIDKAFVCDPLITAASSRHPYRAEIGRIIETISANRLALELYLNRDEVAAQ